MTVPAGGVRIGRRAGPTHRQAGRRQLGDRLRLAQADDVRHRSRADARAHEWLDLGPEVGDRCRPADPGRRSCPRGRRPAGRRSGSPSVKPASSAAADPSARDMPTRSGTVRSRPGSPASIQPSSAPSRTASDDDGTAAHDDAPNEPFLTGRDQRRRARSAAAARRRRSGRRTGPRRAPSSPGRGPGRRRPGRPCRESPPSAP